MPALDPAIFTKAKKKNDTYWQLSAIKDNKPDNIDLGDLLWQALREDLFHPGPIGYTYELKRAKSGYSGADVLKLVTEMQNNHAARWHVRRYWLQGSGHHHVTQLTDLIAGTTGNITPLVQGWRQADEMIRPLLSFILVQLGHIPPADIDPESLPWMAWLIVKKFGITDDNDRAHYRTLIAQCTTLWPDDVWGPAIVDAINKQTDNIESYDDLRPHLHRLTDDELVRLCLVTHCRKDLTSSVAFLRERGDAVLPALMTIAEDWRINRDAKGRGGETLNILVSAIMHLNHDAGRPLLDEKYDILIAHAMWNSGGPLKTILGSLPRKRLESLLLDRKHTLSHPFTFYPCCKTARVQQDLIDRACGLTGRADWDSKSRLPAAIVEMGPVMVPKIDAALKSGAGLYHHLLLQCLDSIGDATGVPILVRSFSDTAPRNNPDSRSTRDAQLSDVPEIATRTLIALSRKLPTSAVLPHLTPALTSDDAGVRRCAVTVLAALPSAPEIDAAAALAQKTETDPGLRTRLARLRHLLAAPEAVRALKAEAATPDPVFDAFWPNSWKKEYVAEHRDALLATGPVLLWRWFEALRQQIHEGGSLFGSRDRWLEIVAHFADHPATDWLALESICMMPDEGGYTPYRIVELLKTLKAHLPDLPAQWLARVRSETRPVTWLAFFHLPDEWGFTVDDLLCDALSHPEAEHRDKAIARLKQRPVSNLKAITPLLASRNKLHRSAALQVVSHFPVPEAIPHLKAARKKERVKVLKAELDAALAAYTPAQLAAAPELKAAPKKKAATKAKRTKKAPAPVAARPVWTDWLNGKPLADPTKETWGRLVGRIDQHPPLASEVTLIDAALAHWPDNLRQAPLPWVAAASRKKQLPPHWILTRALHFTRFTSRVSGSLTPARLRWIFTTPHVSRITSLSLSGYTRAKERDAIVDHFAAATALSNLRHLSFDICALPEGFLDAMLNATHLTRLESFSAWRCSYSWSNDKTLEMLKAPHLASLKRISLPEYSSDAFIGAVLDAPTLGNVVELSMRGSRTTDATLVRIAGMKRRWKSLSLAGKGITAAGAEALAASPHMANLEFLFLSSPIEEAGVKALIESKTLPKLEYLILRSTNVSQEYADTLRTHPRTTQLKRLLVASWKMKENLHIELK